MWRRSSMVRVVDVDARARRRARAWGDFEDLAVGVLWALFGWRVELLGLAVIMGAERVLAGIVGEPAAAAVVVVLLGAAAGVGLIRVRVLRVLHAMRVRRGWARAAIDAGVAPGPFRCPGAWSVDRVPAGGRLRGRVRRGQSGPGLGGRREGMAAWPRVRGGCVGRGTGDAGRGGGVTRPG